ncbi:MAG: acyl-ACP--UDP-N-acetylglucosamine O-acyltransferase [Thiotrichales bacterium]|nr:MAG: acyl-ACP--UDP-N-acetylglucosamine O-acyltransferase [Thiotrichales bacterium]
MREFCTFNRGTVQDKGKTVVGNDNWIMAYVHIAHDCVVHNHTVFANNVTLAGHVEIRDAVILGGFTLVHQFCVVGEHAFTAMGTSLAKDLPPFVMAAGAPAEPRKINAEGLRRHGHSHEAIQRIKAIYRLIYRRQLSLKDALAEVQAQYGEFADAQLMLDFCVNSQRGLVR